MTVEYCGEAIGTIRLPNVPRTGEYISLPDGCYQVDSIDHRATDAGDLTDVAKPARTVAIVRPTPPSEP